MLNCDDLDKDEDDDNLADRPLTQENDTRNSTGKCH